MVEVRLEGVNGVSAGDGHGLTYQLVGMMLELGVCVEGDEECVVIWRERKGRRAGGQEAGGGIYRCERLLCSGWPVLQANSH